ncbi:MAG: (Fe-S)-binding protein [Planctomycetota bacterium]|nr:(Fe-S)-binding protein [Planctomycetota bacterium]
MRKVLKVDVSRLSLPRRQTVTYHQSCHLRAIGGSEEPARILEGMGHVDYRAMEGAETCCGFSGTFAVKYPPISRAMAEQKVRSIGAAGAEIAVCNEAGCSLNISGMCHRKGGWGEGEAHCGADCGGVGDGCKRVVRQGDVFMRQLDISYHSLERL